MSKLKGKVAIVTGGASGIGEATVRQFVTEGAKVVINDIDVGKGMELEKELTSLDANVIFIKADITNESQVENLISKTVKKFGQLDVVFNNAGVANLSLSHEMEFKDWTQTLNVNIDGVFLVSKHAIRQMLKNNGGSIVNVSSIMGHVATSGQSSYNASKHAVLGLTKSLGLEYAKDNIRVNAVCPGYVETPLLDFLSDDEKQELASLHPIGRLGKPTEIAKTVVFLASDDASFITGTSLLIDGGYTAQ